MSKIKKADLLQLVQEQADMMVELSGMVKMNKLSIIKLENEREKPQLKQLDQSVFDHKYVTNYFYYAAINANGQSIFFSDTPKCNLELGIWYSTAGSTMPMLKGYDASNWQNSLIERDTAKELTGSDLARAMLERGDKCVMIRMGARDDKQARDIGRFAIATGIDESGRFNVMSDQQPISKVDFAVPVNNQGEPLTASEVGL